MEGFSYSEKHSIVYKWKINDITSFINAARVTEERETIISPKFSVNLKINDSWHLEFRIDKDSKSLESKSWISLYVMSNNDKKIKAKYIIYILDNNNRKRSINLVVITDPANSEVDRFFDNSHKGYGSHKFAKINELFEKKNELLKNDTLTICVDLTVYDDYIAVNKPLNLLKGTKRKLTDDFKDLFVAKKNCDVVIKVGDESFVAHKFLLTTRSSVFNAMFSLDIKSENKDNKINIPDINPEVFKKVLDYIYTDQVEELDKFDDKLLEAADKYQLQGLKEMCEESLAKGVTVDNVISILVLAGRHNANLLKEFAINYVVNDFVKFKSSEELKALKKSQPYLYIEVLEKHSMGN